MVKVGGTVSASMAKSTTRLLPFFNSNGAIMLLYKKLSCENYTEINQQILQFVESKNLHTATEEFWNPVDALEFVKSVPLFNDWLRQHNLKLHTVAVTVGNKVNCCPIHTDTPPAVNKLSWPVLNTNNTFNRWFQSRVDTPTVVVNSLGGQSYIDINELEQIGEMEVAEPCIINAGIPHDVWFPDPAQAVFPRLGLQCKILPEPVL